MHRTKDAVCQSQVIVTLHCYQKLGDMKVLLLMLGLAATAAGEG